MAQPSSLSPQKGLRLGEEAGEAEDSDKGSDEEQTDRGEEI